MNRGLGLRYTNVVKAKPIEKVAEEAPKAIPVSAGTLVTKAKAERASSRVRKQEPYHATLTELCKLVIKETPPANEIRDIFRSWAAE